MVSETITIRNNGAYILEIYLEHLTDISQRNWKKLCKMLTRENVDANGPARESLEKWFPQKIEEAEDLWNEKSRDFQNGYRDTKYLPQGGRTAIKRKNDQLFSAVKAAKRYLDRINKFHSIYREAVNTNLN